MPYATFRERCSLALGVRPEMRPALLTTVYELGDISDWNYWLELLLACAIATSGLVLDSPAVVIGAMLISPLMGPIVSAGLALTTADLYLALRSALGLAASIAASISFSALIVWLLPFHSPTGQILARTQPNLLDLAVAVCSGLAGSVQICRSVTGKPGTTLPGVAIAVSLMPPLCTVGFGLGSGGIGFIMSGAMILFLTNLAAIVIAAFLVFWVVRMESRDVREALDAAVVEKASRDKLFRWLRSTAMGRAFGDVNQWQWRLALLVLSVGLLYWPLRGSFQQLRDEAVARTETERLVERLLPNDAIVKQALDLDAQNLRLTLMATKAVDAGKVRAAEIELAGKTGKNVEIHLQRVAAEEDLARLRSALVPVAPRAVAQAPAWDPGQVREELLGEMDRGLEKVWPSGSAAIVGRELSLDEKGYTLRIRYKGRPLPEAVRESVEKTLRASSKLTNLNVTLLR